MLKISYLDGVEGLALVFLDSHALVLGGFWVGLRHVAVMI